MITANYCILPGASRTIDAMVKLNDKANTLAKHKPGPRRRKEFDPNEYLTVLPHLRLADGYCLDYLYHKTEMAGYPWLYVRKTDGTRLEQPAYMGDEDAPYEKPYDLTPIYKLIPDGSPESWFELELFDRLAGQFSLFWHARENDFRFITTQAEIGALGEKWGAPADFAGQAIGMEHTVIVSTQGRRAMVEYTGFTSGIGIVRYRATYADHPGQQPTLVELKLIPFERDVYY